MTGRTSRYVAGPVELRQLRTLHLTGHFVWQNDLLQWIMDIARERDFSDEAIARRIMLVCFAAIHTSSNVSSCCW